MIRASKRTVRTIWTPRAGLRGAQERLATARVAAPLGAAVLATVMLGTVMLGTAVLTGCGGGDAPRPTHAAAATPSTESRDPQADREVASGASFVGGRPRWSLEGVIGLDRVGRLTDRQRTLLVDQGFFLAPQPPRSAAADPEGARGARRATHLFHVYERNDYIRMPSYVTADVAIDAVHAYFEAVIRDVETLHLAGQLREALVELMEESGALAAAAQSATARREASRALTFWAVALQLLEVPAPGDAAEIFQPASAYEEELSPEERAPAAAAVRPPSSTPIPAAVRGDVNRTVARVRAHTGMATVVPLRRPVDLSQMLPRGNYTRTGLLMRYFRAMSWLGQASFDVRGEHADVAAIALLSRCLLAREDAAHKLEGLLAVTAFFAGEPDAATLAAAAQRLRALDENAAQMTADALIAPDFVARYQGALGDLPPPRIGVDAPAEGPQIRVIGRRAFEDAVAMQGLIETAVATLTQTRDGSLAMPLTGALASAAVLGSATAAGALRLTTPADQQESMVGAIDAGRTAIGRLDDERWNRDAYHGTLAALGHLIATPAPSSPELLLTDGYRLRALYAYAGGWAELRHATILYGEQSGAECDAPDETPPPGYIEPVVEVYRQLDRMVQQLQQRLRAAGVPLDGGDADNVYYRPLADKAEQVRGLLRFLTETAELERQGRALDEARRVRITTLGGEIEWLLITLANTDLLAERDQDMAIVADVFSFRNLGKAVEVGIGHPDLIYAIVPTREGPTLARGAIMSYREFLAPMSDRLTDEAWRARVAAGQAPDRPAWVNTIYAEPVGAVLLAEGEGGVDRCGPMSAFDMEL